MRKLRLREVWFTCLKSMNLSFEFEPDSNIYILDHSPEDLRVYCLYTSSMDCNRCYSFTEKKKKGLEETLWSN